MLDRYAWARANGFWLAIAALASLYAVIALLSGYVAYNVAPALVPIALFVVGAMLAAGITIAVFVAIRAGTIALPTLRTIFIVGLIFRFMMVPSVPILEDDWIRYLWEGALTANGLSPAQIAPVDAYDSPISPDDPNLIEAQAISAAAGGYAEEVAYPQLTTIYPLVAQASFAIAHILSPFDLTAWRLLLVVVDVGTFGLLALWLTRLGKPPQLALLYWWHPLAVLCGINAGHMDLLLLPFILGAVLLAREKRPIFSGSLLGLSIGIKLWPVLLMPFLFRIMRGDAVRPIVSPASIRMGLMFATPAFLLGALLTGPLLVNAADGASGLSAYAATWQKNALLFPAIESVFVDGIGLTSRAPRLFVAGLIILFTAGLALNSKPASDISSVRDMAIILGTVIFLAPAGYPWYLLWVLPFLVVFPLVPLLVLSATFFLYYLRFPLAVQGDSWVFERLIIPVEFGVPLAFVSIALAKAGRARWTSA